MCITNCLQIEDTMLIINTTYHASAAVYDNFVEWLCCEYIPKVKSGGVLLWPQLTRVLDGSTGADGYSYALQFYVKSVDAFNAWYTGEGKKLHEEMARRFGRDVAGFSTWMEEIDTE